MEVFDRKGEVRLRFRLRTVSAGLLGDKKRCNLGKDDNVSNMMGLWKICISFYTVESLQDIEEAYWVRLKALKILKSEWQNGETNVMKVELVYCWVDQ